MIFINYHKPIEAETFGWNGETWHLLMKPGFPFRQDQTSARSSKPRRPHKEAAPEAAEILRFTESRPSCASKAFLLFFIYNSTRSFYNSTSATSFQDNFCKLLKLSSKTSGWSTEWHNFQKDLWFTEISIEGYITPAMLKIINTLLEAMVRLILRLHIPSSKWLISTAWCIKTISRALSWHTYKSGSGCFIVCPLLPLSQELT